MHAAWSLLVAAFLITPTSSTESRVIILCPTGWMESTESETCIKIFNEHKSWFDARSTCKALGGDLVKIVSYAMNEFIHGHLENRYPPYPYYHIGLNAIKHPGQYRWLDSSSTPIFTRWHPQEPAGTFKCVGISLRDGKWLNYNCFDEDRFICEKTTACHEGRYGERCSNLCSETCGGLANTCDRVDGACKNGCDPGYTGTKCDQVCDSGFYDERCEKICSEHCVGAENSCHHVNGTCDLGCDPGYKNETCNQECDSGYYGERCSKPCNENCAGETNHCHHVNGTCDLGCDPGFQGDWCTEEMPLDRKVEEKEQEVNRWTTTVIIVAAVVGGVCVAVALLVIGLRVYRRRNLSREQQCKQTEQGSVMVYGLLAND